HLPAPELIAAQIPNPCGHGTGMEDSMLSAGTMMDTVIARYAAEGDEAMRGYAADIYRGMELCASVSDKRGYLPRSVSPADGRSHYGNSSRDQYTHWIYGAYRFYYSPLSDEKQRASIRRCLTDMAKMCEAEVTEENDWNILREDGKIGIVCKMWGELSPHEYFRLPMLYLLTWKVTGNAHWKRLYDGMRAHALAKTLEFPVLSGRTYVGLQLQYSLRLVYDLDEDAAFRETLLAFMTRMAKAYERETAVCADAVLTPEGLAGLDWKYKPWDKVRALYVGYIGGKVYYNPNQSEFGENRAFYPLRAVGETVTIAALCPGYTVSGKTMAQLLRVADAVHYDTHVTYAPMALLNAYWTAREAAHGQG
ncbi:MAG: hypothetical protein ACI3XM_06080, partial [Eubacteriales bacterium]